MPSADRRAGRGRKAPHLHLRVFLASPGDVADERGIAVRTIGQLPYDPLLRGRVTLEAVAWDKEGARTPMHGGRTPQAAVARSLAKPSDCDIVVVILWSRMGTPLPGDERKADGSAYVSGTEWEYLEALGASRSTGKPEILVYRRTERCLLDADDPDFEDKLRQRRKVKEFFAGFHNPDGSIARGYNEYATPEDFRLLLDHHLRVFIGPMLDEAIAAGRTAPRRATAVAAPPLWQGSPFPGLRAFTPDDATIFFGRGRETDDLVRRCSDPAARFVMVVGASGSGKSSLVAAGLIPRLMANAVEGSKDWLLPGVAPAAGAGERKQWVGLRFTPGELSDNPFEALAAKLAPFLGEQEARTPRRLAERLDADPASIEALADKALANRPLWAEALLFIDQFEELFTVVAERHRGPFIELLRTAAKAGRLRTVATLRADFYERCVEWPALTEILTAASYPLAAPARDALSEMISGPAARAGLDFDAGLVDRILDDAGSGHGALALVAFALHELYRARTAGGRLARAAYQGFGGVQGAVRRRAEETFKSLPAPAREQLGSVFRELMEVDERGAATRRRTPRARVAPSNAAGQLVDAFVDARLLVTDRGPAGEAMVEVAHEALLREWPVLASWISGRAGDLRLWRQAQEAAADWERSGRDPGLLWLHERLALVERALGNLAMDRASLAEPARFFLRSEAERLLAELDQPGTSHDRRAEIGERLDRIGDPRPGVGLRPDGVPDIDWREIPGGTVTLRGIQGSFEVGPFSITRYPVTYRQYRAFLDDPGGHRDWRWWEGLNLGAPGEQLRTIGNCPAETVFWHEAMAYCRWLSARLGYEVRLPTEPEWQQAATGGNPSNQYPWGPDWVEGRANTSESGLGRTTAVGMYPAGATSQGVLDLVGNVHEWCLTNSEDPHAGNAGLDEEEQRKQARRVVRGGSFDVDHNEARCGATRANCDPNRRHYKLGFRVVRVSPIPEH